MARHPWLNGVRVQGEMEMEFAEAERRRSGEVVAGAAAAAAESSAGGGSGKKEKKKEKKGALEEVLKLGPAVKGMVGMGRI